MTLIVQLLPDNDVVEDDFIAALICQSTLLLRIIAKDLTRQILEGHTEIKTHMSALLAEASQEPPESPTTARELVFDDEAPENTSSSPTRNTSSKVEQQSQHLLQETSEDAPPPKPPRPVNPQIQAENTLKEAFPTIDAAVIKAVLRASGGNVEPAFNALLEMSDPDARREPTPPLQPPRRPTGPTSTAPNQLAADEQYARQLAEHYNGAAAYGAPRQRSRGRQYPPTPGPQRTSSRQFGENEERERSFIDDDLPIIRDNIKKGFLETQTKVNSWVTNLRKKIDGDDDEEYQERPPPAASGYGNVAQRQPSYSRRSGDYQRRSADHDRYDADPQVLGDDFTNLQLKDHEGPPVRSSRPLANPNLFKPTPPRPQSNSGRRVSFQDGPPEEIGVQQVPTSPPDSTKRTLSATSGKSSKWQPLAAVDPNPVGDHDPFSLGDSDDEDAKKKDVKPDDGEKLKQAAAEAMAGSIGADEEKKPEPQGKNGSAGAADQESVKSTGAPTA